MEQLSNPEEKRPLAPRRGGVRGRLHFILTLLAGGVLMLLIGMPVILTGLLLRALFGVEDFIFLIAKPGVKLFVRSTGARIHLSGLEHADPAQTYVFVANHQSTLDPPILFSYLKHNVGAIAKQELEKIPFFKQGFSLAHIVPIDRSNRDSAIESTKRGAAELRNGNSLMAFPEGTRSMDGRLREFKKGVFYMAIEAGVPIVPVVINDTHLVMPKVGGVVIPGPVTVEILPPVSTAGYTAETVQDLIDHVRALMAPHIK